MCRQVKQSDRSESRVQAARSAPAKQVALTQRSDPRLGHPLPRVFTRQGMESASWRFFDADGLASKRCSRLRCYGGRSRDTRCAVLWRGRWRGSLSPDFRHNRWRSSLDSSFALNTVTSAASHIILFFNQCTTQKKSQ